MTEIGNDASLAKNTVFLRMSVCTDFFILFFFDSCILYVKDKKGCETRTKIIIFFDTAFSQLQDNYSTVISQLLYHSLVIVWLRL